MYATVAARTLPQRAGSSRAAGSPRLTPKGFDRQASSARVDRGEGEAAGRGDQAQESGSGDSYARIDAQARRLHGPTRADLSDDPRRPARHRAASSLLGRAYVEGVRDLVDRNARDIERNPARLCEPHDGQRAFGHVLVAVGRSACGAGLYDIVRRAHDVAPARASATYPRDDHRQQAKSAKGREPSTPSSW